ncbi:MAG TPA: DJ-1/PfpI family protein, partial [Thermoanaerobaculia bacterium]
MKSFTICIPIVPEFDMMDVANPYEIFSWMHAFWRLPDLELHVLLAGHEAKTSVKSFNGAELKTHASFDELADRKIDVLFVPGGGDAYIKGATSDAKLLEFVRDHAGDAQWVASV